MTPTASELLREAMAYVEHFDPDDVNDPVDAALAVQNKAELLTRISAFLSGEGHKPAQTPDDAEFGMREHREARGAEQNPPAPAAPEEPKRYVQHGSGMVAHVDGDYVLASDYDLLRERLNSAEKYIESASKLSLANRCDVCYGAGCVGIPGAACPACDGAGKNRIALAFKWIELERRAETALSSRDSEARDAWNYVADREIEPTVITFANGRVVRVVGDGYLTVERADG